MTSQQSKTLDEGNLGDKKLIFMQNHFLIIVAIWTCLVLSSFGWHLWKIKRHNEQLLLEKARCILKVTHTIQNWENVYHANKKIPSKESLTPQSGEENINSTTDKSKKTFPVVNAREIIKNFLTIYHLQGNNIKIQISFVNKTLEAWEAKAIWNFQHGQIEVFEFVRSNEKEYLRLALPLFADKISSSNMTYSNIQPEDIIGCQSIFLPIEPNLSRSTSSKLIVLLTHCIVFVIISTLIYQGYKIITLHKKSNDIMNSQLKREQKHLKKVLELLPAGIIITDRKTRKIIDTNPYALSILECDKNSITGDDYSKYIKEPPHIGNNDDHESDKSNLTEAKLITNDGKTKSVLKTTITTHLENKPVLLECFINIDNIKNLEAENLKQEKLRGVLEMAGTVCHEFNQPLQVIIGYCELVSNYGWQDFDIEKMFASISRESERMGTLTNKLASLSEYRPKKYLDSNIVDISQSEDTYSG